MKKENSQYQKDNQDILFTHVDLDTELLPVALSQEDEVEAMKEMRCRKQLCKMEEIEGIVEKLQIIIFGDIDNDGFVIRNEKVVEELQTTIQNLLALAHHLDKMLIEGLKTSEVTHSKSLYALEEKLNNHEGRLCELENNKSKWWGKH